MSFCQKLFTSPKKTENKTDLTAPVTLKGGVDNYDKLFLQQDLILLKNLYPDIMSQVDVGQLPTNINNFNPMDIVNELKNETWQKFEQLGSYGLKSANNFLNRKRPEAQLLMDLSIDKFKTVKDNSQFIVLQPSNNAKITQQYNLNTPGLAIDPKWYGVAFANDSDMSRKLSNSPQLQKQVRSSFDSNRNVFKTDKIGIELNQDRNLHYSIGHGTILNPYIDNQGYFNGVLYDIYDFDFIDFDFSDWENIKNSKTTAINNIAYGLQKANQIDKYYVLVPIKFKL